MGDMGIKRGLEGLKRFGRMGRGAGWDRMG
jgi:hypothetical protein